MPWVNWVVVYTFMAHCKAREAVPLQQNGSFIGFMSKQSKMNFLLFLRLLPGGDLWQFCEMLLNTTRKNSALFPAISQCFTLLTTVVLWNKGLVKFTKKPWWCYWFSSIFNAVYIFKLLKTKCQTSPFFQLPAWECWPFYPSMLENIYTDMHSRKKLQGWFVIMLPSPADESNRQLCHNYLI